MVESQEPMKTKRVRFTSLTNSKKEFVPNDTSHFINIILNYNIKIKKNSFFFNITLVFDGSRSK